MAMIKLQSSDGYVMEVEEKVALMSKVLRDLIEDGCNKDGEAIRIQLADAVTLSKVLFYLKKHSEANAGDLKTWDMQFKNEINSFPKLFKLITASDYLNVQDLLDLTSDKAVEMLKDLSVEQVRELFMLPENDFTREEEATIRRRFAWAFQ